MDEHISTCICATTVNKGDFTKIFAKSVNRQLGNNFFMCCRIAMVSSTMSITREANPVFPKRVTATSLLIEHNFSTYFSKTQPCFTSPVATLLHMNVHSCFLVILYLPSGSTRSLMNCKNPSLPYAAATLLHMNVHSSFVVILYLPVWSTMSLIDKTGKYVFATCRRQHHHT